MFRTRTITGAGVIATAALVLLFGNQAVTEWVARHATTGSLWDWFLHRLTWPSWILAPRNGSSSAFRSMLSQDLRALFLILFVAIILAMIAILIGYEAVTRFIAPVPIRFAEAIPIACLGLVVNVASAWLLSSGGWWERKAPTR